MTFPAINMNIESEANGKERILCEHKLIFKNRQNEVLSTYKSLKWRFSVKYKKKVYNIRSEKCQFIKIYAISKLWHFTNLGKNQMQTKRGKKTSFLSLKLDTYFVIKLYNSSSFYCSFTIFYSFLCQMLTSLITNKMCTVGQRLLCAQQCHWLATSIFVNILWLTVRKGPLYSKTDLLFDNLINLYSQYWNLNRKIFFKFQCQC